MGLPRGAVRSRDDALGADLDIRASDEEDTEEVEGRTLSLGTEEARAANLSCPLGGRGKFPLPAG